MITIKDIKLSNSNYEHGLSLLVGQKIKEVRGYFSAPFGDPAFKITHIELEDGTLLGVGGEHDFPYVESPYRNDKVLNLDYDTLQRLYDEQNEED